MKLQTFLDELYKAGWRGTHDAQSAGVTRIWRNAYPAAAEYLDDLIAADSRIAELEAERDELVRFKEDAILACAKHRCSKWEAALMDAEARAEVDAEIGRKWHADSSLETWFPYTAEELTRLRAELVAARARADAAVAEAAEHKMFREESARRLAQCRVDRDRLRAAGRSLLACPHIAERDTDPDWVDAETEAAVAEMRAALKET